MDSGEGGWKGNLAGMKACLIEDDHGGKGGDTDTALVHLRGGVWAEVEAEGLGAKRRDPHKAHGGRTQRRRCGLGWLERRRGLKGRSMVCRAWCAEKASLGRRTAGAGFASCAFARRRSDIANGRWIGALGGSRCTVWIGWFGWMRRGRWVGWFGWMRRGRWIGWFGSEQSMRRGGMKEGGEMGAEEEGGESAKDKEGKQQQEWSGSAERGFALGWAVFAEESVFIKGGGEWGGFGFFEVKGV